MKQALKVGGGLIAMYLAVYYATGFGSGVTQLTKGLQGTVKAFQGR